MNRCLAQIWDQVRAQVRAQVWDQVWDQVRDQVRAQVWAQVGAQVRVQVEAQVEDQVKDMRYMGDLRPSQVRTHPDPISKIVQSVGGDETRIGRRKLPLNTPEIVPSVDTRLTERSGPEVPPDVMRRGRRKRTARK